MDTELLIIDDESEIIIEVDTDVEVLEAAAQGPRGPQGIPGPAGGTSHIRNSAAALSATRCMNSSRFSFSCALSTLVTASSQVAMTSIICGYSSRARSVGNTAAVRLSPGFT